MSLLCTPCSGSLLPVTKKVLTESLVGPAQGLLRCGAVWLTCRALAQLASSHLQSCQCCRCPMSPHQPYLPHTARVRSAHAARAAATKQEMAAAVHPWLRWRRRRRTGCLKAPCSPCTSRMTTTWSVVAVDLRTGTSGCKQGSPLGVHGLTSCCEKCFHCCFVQAESDKDPLLPPSLRQPPG